MQRDISDDDEPLEDLTAAITLHSKRTERMQRRKATKDRKESEKMNIAGLPTEIALEVLELLSPSDLFRVSAVNRRFRDLVFANANVIGEEIIRQRYTILSKCFPLPTLLAKVEPTIQPMLTDPKRQKQLSIHNKPYQHVQPPDSHLVCTCLTCILTWNNLGLVLDFGHWQLNLDNGEPIPMLPRGQVVQWNQDLINRHERMTRKALGNRLWYARILEIHLDSTVKSIKRHAKNKGNKRKHVEMTEEDAATGTDHFLEKAGPLSLEFPFQRDEYYMLEAYLPNRWWRKDEQRWIYTIVGQHEHDLELVVRLASRDVTATPTSRPSIRVA
ncbi:hypothetical protein K491DRAFT_678952 [Lophiostoma macrostomum CBS 122681]|uniref:F-box domain-containing protein n=1 Tax=Lophiostoma macrostomum CBS 122681 TaxID=1314788 RepID=A0A6A6T7U2_9PLEO|nr:hypothetical protein K491DRAFT_678952 [Lophiostoma macrostomum CBS 122681]